MLQLTQAGAVVRGDAEDIARMRGTFECQHVLRLPQFLPAVRLRYLQDALARAAFVARAKQDGIGEVCLSRAEPVWDHLLFMMNDPTLFHWIEQLTGCDPIGCFSGRVWRGVDLDWHDDWVQARMIGISVNLSTEVFSGGALRVREKASHTQICDVTNTGFGDAVLFRISEHLEHRVTPVEGTAHRTVLTGWFRREPSYLAEMDAAIVAERPVLHGNPDRPDNGWPTELRLSDDVLYHAAGDDLLIHVNGQSGFYRLNAIGREILERLAATGEPAVVMAQMLDEYDVSDSELRQEVRRVVTQLRRHGVLEPRL